MSQNKDGISGGNEQTKAYGEQRKFVGLESFIIWRRMKAAERVLEKISSTNKAPKVLELGCGFHGSNLRYLSKLFPSATFVGVDFQVNPELKDKKIKLISADLAGWRPDARYDCVLSLAVVEHMVDLRGHFNLIHDALGYNGMAVMTTPKPQAHFVLRLMSALGIFDRESISDHKLYLTRAGIEKLAEDSRLKLLDYRSILVLNQTCTMVRAQND